MNNAETVLRDALALPDSARADLAAELLASLEEPADDDLETVSSKDRSGRRVHDAGFLDEELEHHLRAGRAHVGAVPRHPASRAT